MQNRSTRPEPAVLQRALAPIAGHPAEHNACRLAELFERREVAKNALLVEQGALWHKAYFIESGLVRLFFTTPDGREFNKNFFMEGNLIWPSTATLREQPSLFSIAALEPSRIWCADFPAFQQRLAEYGSWQQFALATVESIMDHKFLREYDLLMLDAKARYLAFAQKAPQLAERIPDYHLASYLGMTNVSLSRIKRQCREDKGAAPNRQVIKR